MFFRFRHLELATTSAYKPAFSRQLMRMEALIVQKCWTSLTPHLIMFDLVPVYDWFEYPPQTALPALLGPKNLDFMG